MRKVGLLIAVVGLAACGGDGDGDDGTGTPEPGPFDAVPLGETVTAGGLSAPVDVVRDEYGVAHIHAKNVEDLAFANGYVMAQDRIQQMDLFRHVSRGRVARLFGSLDQGQIDDDLEMRMHQLGRVAELAWEQLRQSTDPADQELTRYMLRFADGINQYNAELLAGTRELDAAVSVFFDPSRFEPWTPVDSLAIGRLQAWSLSYDDRDLERTEALQRALDGFGERGAAMWADLIPMQPVDPTSTISGWSLAPAAPAAPARERRAKRPRVPSHLFDAARRALAPRSALAAALKHPDNGSNNWVVGPAHTAGETLLANDPHLTLSSPSIFYLVHLTVPGDVDVQGISFGGVPGVILGHNQTLAWGGTVVNHDVTDFYLETIVPCSSGGGDCVVYDGGEVRIETWTEEIEIGALGTVTDTRTVTYEHVPHHGPIVPNIVDHDIAPRTGNQAISVKYTGYDITHDLRAFQRLWRARNVDEGIAAMERFEFGGQNWVFADAEGNIGWTTHVNVPLRSQGCFTFDVDTATDGVAPYLVLPGDGSCEWDGFLAPASIPQAVNPERGYLATANSDPVGYTFDGDAFDDATVDGRPLYLGAYDYANGLRLGRITRRLELARDGGPMSADTMASIQADARSNVGELLAPHVVAAVAKMEQEIAIPGTHADLEAFVAGLSAAKRAALSEAGARLEAWTLDTPAAVEGSPSAAEIADSAATTIFNHWMVYFVRGAFDDELGVLGWRGGTRMTGPAVNLFHRPDELRTGIAPETGEPALCDDLGTADAVESCALIALVALDQALGHAAGAFGSADMDAWRWGELHRLVARAQLPDNGLSIPPPNDPDPGLRDGYPRHGDGDSVDASHPGYNDFDFGYGHGPAMRHVTAFLADGTSETRMALPGGQSSDRASGHFRDLMDTYWRRNEYFVMPFATAQIIERAEARMRLVPE